MRGTLSARPSPGAPREGAIHAPLKWASRGWRGLVAEVFGVGFVFLVTASHDPKLLGRAKELGITEYLFKGDVPFMRMLEMIKKTLGEPYTPIRRGRRPKNPQAQPPNGQPEQKKAPPRPAFDFDDEDEDAADAEFMRD